MNYESPVSLGRIILSNYEERDRSGAEIIEALNQQLQGIEIPAFVKFSLDAGGPPPGEPVEVRVVGGLADDRNQAVDQVSQWLAQQSGIEKVTNNEALVDVQLKMNPQYEWLARYGLTVADLAAHLRIAFEGEQVTSTWLGDQEVDIRVILDKKYQTSEALDTTKIHTPDGQQVPLNRLVKVEPIEAPRLIQHYQGEREVTVTAQIAEGSAITPVELSLSLLQAMDGKFPAGVSLDVGGEAESTNETMSGFMVAFPVAMIGIYFVLALMFNSMLQPLLVMAVIPFAIVAAMLVLLVHLQPLSLFALVGMLGMTGVVVNNSLVLINHINELREEGMDIVEAVTSSAVSRLRPILLTSTTTVVGLLPLAYGIGGTDVFMGPMSLTLGYGLLFSLPVVLIVTPVLYCFCSVKPTACDHK